MYCLTRKTRHDDNRAWAIPGAVKPATRLEGKAAGIFFCRCRDRGSATKGPGRVRAPITENACILDLATGDGRVMTSLLTARRDLKPVGIDRESRLPDAPRGTLLEVGVPLEDLPFPNERFAAISSRFGSEYSDPAFAVRDVRGILAGNGIVGLLMHGPDGPILAHNLSRRDQID